MFNMFKGTFSGRVNKMWAGGLAVGILKAAQIGFGIELSPIFETAILGVLTGGVVYHVKNY